MWAQYHDPANRARRVAAEARRAVGARLGQLRVGPRRAISLSLGVMVILGLAAFAVVPRITNASAGAEVSNVLANGSFEQGFSTISGCGDVGVGWNCFTNGGAANYGFYADEWDRVVSDGKASQLIEINTNGMAAADSDRYAGISQTVKVVKGEKYTFSLRGIIRTTNQSGDPWRYRVQVGYLHGPQGDWRQVENWADVGWNTYYERTEPGTMGHFQTTFTPDAEVITVFVRVWKKWGVANEELDVNVDELALVGLAPRAQPRNHPQQPEQKRVPGTGTGGPVGPKPEEKAPEEKSGPAHDGPRAGGAPHLDGPVVVDGPAVCNGPDIIGNGSFEQGFYSVDFGEVGRGWETFTNGGQASYGFAEEEWDVLLADGHSGQLIEISSKSVYPTDADRYAGIYQRLSGMQPGGIYELTLRGGMRGAGNEEDAHRFAAQWGVAAGSDWRHVDEWETMDLGPIQPSTQPTLLSEYTVRFRAPGPQTTLFIRGWKKWAVTDQEFMFNLDAIGLRGCSGVGGPQKGPKPSSSGPAPREIGPHPEQRPDPDQKPAAEQQPDPVDTLGSCRYVVKAGDMLSQIARQFGVDVQDITRANAIENTNIIYVGQELQIPGCNRRAGERGEPENRPGGEPDSRPGGEPDSRSGNQPADRMPQPVEVDPSMRPDPPGREDRMPMPAMDAQVEKETREKNASVTTYTVQQGDMLGVIAQEYGVASDDLAAYNGIGDTNMLYVGQVLRIPGRVN